MLAKEGKCIVYKPGACISVEGCQCFRSHIQPIYHDLFAAQQP